jgi:DNA polymerase-3 subunit alpha (Gram-positive type)
MIGDGQNIPFATFLGFHAEKVPDIDLNFPSDFQSTAHEHIKSLLGEKNVFKAGTIQTTQEKNARGYVLGYFESLNKDTSKIRNAEIDRIAMGCIDVKRTTGQHPGGVIVIPDNMEVYDFTPVQYPADEVDSSWKTTHYDFPRYS